MISKQTLMNFTKKIHYNEIGCWTWTAAVFKGLGYGKFNLNGKTSYAHRVMYSIINGVISKGYDICHTCDNRLCVNPEHLFLGTRSDNMQDAKKKGRLRQQKVTNCPHGHKYSDDNVFINVNGARECKICIKLRNSSSKKKQYRKEYYLKFKK